MRDQAGSLDVGRPSRWDEDELDPADYARDTDEPDGTRPGPTTALPEDLDVAGEDLEQGIAYRPNGLPQREEDDEELAEADLLETLGLDDGPDA